MGGEVGGGGTNTTGGGGALVGGGRSGSGGTAGANGGGGSATQPGELAGCVASISGLYVVRADGIALYEPSANNEHVIVDAATGLPLTGVRAVQGGSHHGCALLSSGAVSCWQTNATAGNLSGQLGNGTTMSSSVVFRSTPVLVAANTPLTNVTAFANGALTDSGLNSTCVLTKDQAMWCWGDLTWIVNNGVSLSSGYGQPITMDGATALSGVIQASYAFSGACAVVEGQPNQVWCWGVNGSNELAQGDTVNRKYPVKVLGLTSPTQVLVANNNTLDNTVCIIDDDTVKCWGDNFTGATGTNTAATVASPKRVVTSTGSPLSGVTDLKAGTAAIGALRNDKTLWVWGSQFQPYVDNFGVTNVVAIGYVGGGGGNGPRFLTSDGMYHNGTAVIPVTCGALQ